ncbi:hypothetical protein FDO65_19685 [Nakamurella flava]|uniref:Uncharacterized protein n=1 Tax=Nakamurella flava TaxID=2576308 RepID=A0A4U6QAX2_9ACTN|nr:hypothetical protein [Nakamurella flava]TKV57036.1 hypothetical protein FDO65_19685 [Nakamurella flava]
MTIGIGEGRAGWVSRPVRRRWLPALTIAVALGAAPLAGCAAADRPAAAADSPPTAQVPPTPGQVMPQASTAGPEAGTVAAALVALRSDLEVTGVAESVLVGECVRQAGYPVRPSDPQAEPDRETFAAYPSPTPESAARSGYGIAGRVLTAQTAVSGQAWLEVDETYKAGLTLAMFGDPQNQVEVTFADGYSARIGADGCYADVRRSFFGDLGEYAQQSWAASQAFGRAIGAVAENRTWKAALAPWSACMSAAGQPGYAAPGDIRMALFQRVAAIEVTSPSDRVDRYRQLAADERALAMQDAACADSTGLDDAWVAAVAADDPDGLAASGAQITAWAGRLAPLAPQVRDRAIAAAGA